MHQRTSLEVAILIGLCVVQTHSYDTAKAIQNIEQGLQHLKKVFFVSNYCNYYIGCYQDKPDRVLKGFELKGDASMTKEKCIYLCTAGKYKYAGLQFANECFCGNKFNSTKRPEKECSTPCSGNKDQICGGMWRISVYRLK